MRRIAIAAAGLLASAALVLGCAEGAPEPPASSGAGESEAVHHEPTEVPEHDVPSGDPVRLLVEVQPTQSVEDIRSAAAILSDVEIAPLFAEAEDETLSRIYLVKAKVGDDVPERGWDLAYRIEERGGFPNVEPDRFDTLMPETNRRMAAQLCDLEGDEDNTDLAWALRSIHADTAWALEPASGGKRYGEGVRICHPDTGWSDHEDLDRVDEESAWNVMNGTADARDPLRGSFPLSPGHGTATGSVIASSGGVAEDHGTTPPGLITGVAPKATLVPIRTVDSVMQFFDSDVAKAVYHAVVRDCDVISMSLGGRGFFGLDTAARYAADHGLIVVAAAGNCVGGVVAPALYDDVIAVAATGGGDLPWKHSAHGPEVVIAAPGEDVWIARRKRQSDPNDRVKTSNGTSFATAEVAGAAALWLAYHGGRDAIEAQAGGERVQDLFARLLKASARKPSDDWQDEEYGRGILDARALLLEDLATPAPPAAPPADPNRSLVLLARLTGRSPGQVREAMRVILGDPDDLDGALDRWGPELMEIMLRDPTRFQSALDAALAPPATTDDPRPRAEARSSLEGLASQRLRAALQ